MRRLTREQVLEHARNADYSTLRHLDEGHYIVSEAEPLTLEQRIKALIYYGTGDEGIELFRQTCKLCYMMNGIGPRDQAELLYQWAKEQAEASKGWADDLEDTAQGHWGY